MPDETTLNARDYAGTRRACGMGHVASGETRRQCSAEESANPAPAKMHTTGHLEIKTEQATHEQRT
jgi:hypothetical protein